MVFDVKYPILGFENVIRFDFKVIDDNFATIQNADGESPAFTLINPFTLREFTFELPAAIRVLMGINESTNYLVYSILVVKKPFSDSTANFLAPLIFNIDNKTMSQVVLDEIKYSHYSTVEPLSNYMTND